MLNLSVKEQKDTILMVIVSMSFIAIDVKKEKLLINLEENIEKKEQNVLLL